MTSTTAAAKTWIERLTRWGYAAKGVVYTLIGLLALLAAFNAGGDTTDSQGVLTTLSEQDFGEVLLVLVGIGFVGYMVWRLIEAIQDPEHHGSGAKNVMHRLGAIVSACIYAGLAFTAFKLALGNGGDDGGNSSQIWIARAMALPLGRWLVGLGGAIVLGSGFSEIYKGIKAKFRKCLKLREMTAKEAAWAIAMGRAGLIARGLVFAMIGLLALQAAYLANPSRAQDPAGALRTLQQWTSPWFFAAIALGLAAYGIHMFFMARYRYIPKVDLSSLEKAKF